MGEMLTAWDRVKRARKEDRPYAMDYIGAICDEFLELHGDRAFGDDGAVIGGIGCVDGQYITVIGQQKGRGIKQNQKRNFGMSSPEGMGTMGTYMVGNLFGTIFFGLLASIGLMTGLHPYALAMACGVGSATMMTASSQALAAALPEMSEEILAYAATSNICSSIDGLYMTLFLGIPIANFIYKKMAGKKK